MQRYFKTNPEAVEITMGVTGVKHHGLVHALLERGYDADEIKAMPPKKRIDEFLGWEGICGWTDTIVNVAKAAGLVVGERKQYDLDDREDQNIREYLDGVVGAVEADSFAQHMLWREYAAEAGQFALSDRSVRFDWQSTGHGYLPTIGYVGDMPVCLSLMTITVKGHKLLFYYATSTFVDHDMVRSWLVENLPDTCKGGYPGGFNHTDAMNFCNVFPREIA